MGEWRKVVLLFFYLGTLYLDLSGISCLSLSVVNRRNIAASIWASVTPICHICKHSYSRFPPSTNIHFEHIYMGNTGLCLSLLSQPHIGMPLKMESWPIIGSRAKDSPNQKRKKETFHFLEWKTSMQLPTGIKKEIELFSVETCCILLRHTYSSLSSPPPPRIPRPPHPPSKTAQLKGYPKHLTGHISCCFPALVLHTAWSN